MPDPKTFTLDKRKVAALQEVSRLWLQDVRLDQAEDYITGNLAFQLSGYMLADHLATDETVVFKDFPASWWQHTKAIHFPTISRWLRRPARFTRQTATVTVDSFATFPEATIPYPDSLGPLRMLQETRISRVDEGSSPWGAA